MSRPSNDANESEDSVNELPLTIRELIVWGARQFEASGLYFGHGTDNALDEANWLVLHALALPFDLPESKRDLRLSSSEHQSVIELLEKRIDTRKPAAYLTGEAWFCGLPFYVNESVLVPRSPIAELIENGFVPWLNGVEAKRVLDLCTGSGCIGIACGYAFPEAELDLSDISTEALKVAQRNIDRHQLSHRVRAIHSDVFDHLKTQKYDLIVSNPPYVDAQDMAALPEEYHIEPELGLAAGSDGLDIAHQILAQAADFLNDDGVLVMEVGNSEAALKQVYPEFPFIWLEFERGGQGVCLTTKCDLVQYISRLSG